MRTPVTFRLTLSLSVHQRRHFSPISRVGFGSCGSCRRSGRPSTSGGQNPSGWPQLNRWNSLHSGPYNHTKNTFHFDNLKHFNVFLKMFGHPYFSGLLPEQSYMLNRRSDSGKMAWRLDIKRSASSASNRRNNEPIYEVTITPSYLSALCFWKARPFHQSRIKEYGGPGKTNFWAPIWNFFCWFYKLAKFCVTFLSSKNFLLIELHFIIFGLNGGPRKKFWGPLRDFI